jgi:hypothetical protein
VSSIRKDFENLVFAYSFVCNELTKSTDTKTVSIDRFSVSVDAFLVSIDRISVSIDAFFVIQHPGGFENVWMGRENHPVSRNGCHPSFVRRGAWVSADRISVSVTYDNVQCSTKKSPKSKVQGPKSKILS